MLRLSDGTAGRGRVGKVSEMGFAMRAATASVAAVALTIGLSACMGTPTSSTTNDSSNTSPGSTSTPDAGGTPTPTPTPTPTTEPAFVPGGTAQENRSIFDLANQAYFIKAGNVIPEGRGVIDNLVSLGFDKKNMQITADRTAIDLPVDSLIFSVLQGDECLIGQFSALGYSTIIAPKLTTGSCLIGLTRAIDW